MSRPQQQHDARKSPDAGLSTPKEGIMRKQLQKTPIRKERGISQTTLPLLCDRVTPTVSKNSRPQTRLEADKHNFAAKTIDDNFESLLEEQAKRRMKLTETASALLMKSVSDRKSNVFPVFVNDPEAHHPRMLPEDVKRIKPEKKLLMAPCLGIAASANLICGLKQNSALSEEEAARYMAQERASNHLLFSWWEERNAFRVDEEEITLLENELGPLLWSCFRQSITEEEGQILLDLKRMQEAMSVKKAVVEPMAASTASGKCNKGAPSSACAFKTAGRGISMPLKFYEKLFHQVMRRLHKRFLMLLQCQDNGENEGIGVLLQTSSKNTKYAQFLLHSQQQMIEAGKKLSSVSGDGNQGGSNGDDDDEVLENFPPLVSIPEERCFRPLLAAETAFSVTLLWRILDQTKAMVPGMAWALQLYTRYVLPHVYENFASYEQHLPWAGAIGEQVEQVHALPLNLLRQRSMLEATAQAREDLRYMEWAMKSWSWRTWRRSVMGQRRHELAIALLDKFFTRFHRMIRLRKCFSEWRVSAKEGRFYAELGAIDRKYDNFLLEARHAAQSMQLFPELNDAATDTPFTIINKNRFVAMKLAETAQHKKGKSVPVTELKSPQDATDTKKDDVSDDSPQQARKISFIGSTTPTESSPSRPSQPPTSTHDDAALEREGVKTSANRTFITSVTQTRDHHSKLGSTRGRATATFDCMLQKLHEMETISGYLRQEIAIQNRLIQKLERENRSLKTKTTELEEKLFMSEALQLHHSNLVQEKDVEMRDMERRIAQLKSRLRCQRQRPWQRTVMRVIGDICGAATTISEKNDDEYVAQNMKSASKRGASVTGSAGAAVKPETTTATTAVGAAPRGESLSDVFTSTPEDEIAQDMEEFDNVKPLTDLALGADEERVFGKLAPLVITSTRFMPDAQTILRDWANNCLNDLESLDHLKGGSLSSRFFNFSEEVRNGVLLSRLLFYLALPRYQNRTAVAVTKNIELKRKASESMDFMEHRRRLLLRENVQLDSPFPTYSECFADLLNLRPSGRMSLLLQFATELIEGPAQLGDEYIQKRLSQIHESALKAIDMTILPPAERVELLEVIDPFALARGDRCATLTLIALLYVRFAHPFNHKAKQCAAVEREAMLYLLSSGTYVPRQSELLETELFHEAEKALPRINSGKKGNDFLAGADDEEEEPFAQKLLAQLEEEEHSPWQLFQKYCQPLIGAMVHPFILRGNFWPSLAFDSPDLAAMLGTLGLALNRSLQEHRWHIIMSCLVPVQTYSGLSRGIFTGRRASPVALQVGLEREGDWYFPMELPCVQAIFLRREEVIREAIGTEKLQSDGTWNIEEVQKEGQFVAMDKSRFMKALETCGTDLLQLFLQRGTLSNVCAMPVLNLGSWRLLWMDVGLLVPDCPEDSLLDLEQVSRIFYTITGAMTGPRKSMRVNESQADTFGHQPLSPLSNEMYYPEFLGALLLLTHEMFPPLAIDDGGGGDDGELEKRDFVWIADAFLHLMFKKVIPSTIVGAVENPKNVLKRIRSNVKTQSVLLRHNKVLLAVFGTYCKDVCGVSAMEREMLLQMLRDAMLTSTEISQGLIYELFNSCSVTKKTEEDNIEDKRREQDARPRDVVVQRRRVNVNIVDPMKDHIPSSGKKKEFSVLLYDGFLEFLCVLCHFKQPNPLIPFDQRLDLFLRRGLLRPLAYRNEALSGLMTHERRQAQGDR